MKGVKRCKSAFNSTTANFKHLYSSVPTNFSNSNQKILSHQHSHSILSISAVYQHNPNCICIHWILSIFSQPLRSNFLVSNQLLIHSLVFNVNSHGKSPTKKVSSDEKCRKFCRKIICPFDSLAAVQTSRKKFIVLKIARRVANF